MSQTHDYTTIKLCALQLDKKCVLVGQSGGLSAVYETHYLGWDVTIVTEHGRMVVAPDATFDVLWPC